MNNKDRIKDILNSYPELFNKEEIELSPNDTYITTFKTWEFYQVFHLTNEETYYLDQESWDNFKDTCDESLPTKEGLIFCYR